MVAGEIIPEETGVVADVFQNIIRRGHPRGVLKSGKRRSNSLTLAAATLESPGFAL
jgi:hypothetical protein